MKHFLFLVLWLVSVQGLALEQYTTADLNDVQKKAQDILQRYSPSEVLVVYDMDNTLLAMDTDLGSDQWFDWQNELLAKEGAQDKVANSVGGLLKVLGVLIQLGPMHLTQNDGPQVLSGLTKKGFTQLLLTSRGIDLRDATERELKRNQLPLWNESSDQGVTVLQPFDINNLQKYCLTEEDKKAFNLSAPRAITVGKNIILSGGQHKGMVLKSYLCQIQKKYKAILFADDKQKNIDAMVAAYGNDPNVELYTFRYAGEDQRVADFHASDKKQARLDWSDLFLTLKTIYNLSFE